MLFFNPTHAENIAKALGGRKVGGGWMARCPAHDDRKPSMSIRNSDDGKALVRCHAGCDQASVIAALRVLGLWRASGRSHLPHTHRQPGRTANELPKKYEANRTESALCVWEATTPAPGTLVEVYLQSRSIDISLPPAVRFHAGLKHSSGGVWPAMVALVTRGADNTPLAIHRTFLANNGMSKAPIDPQKMMLGPCRGGAVRLAPNRSGQWLVIAEGIETTLSVMQACGLSGWAALAAGGIEHLALPPEINKVLICVDNDASGVGQRAGSLAVKRFLDEGRRVRRAMPPVEGQDFNDILLGSPSAPINGDRHVA